MTTELMQAVNRCHLCDLDDNCLRTILAQLAPVPDRFNLASTCKVLPEQHLVRRLVLHVLPGC